jgi:ABC-2 type transport system ATP-binding protein
MSNRLVASAPAASSTDRSAVVVASGVVKRWGSTAALNGASFTIGSGITGLLGANGAGKTTLLGMMLGLHRPSEGQLRVLGLDPVKAGVDVRERVGYSPEHHTLPPDTTAQDLVRHIAEIHGLPTREATGRASDALWQVGLGEERFRPIGTMSTGQRQRVKLAQAIAHDPRLVLLDEPTDGLDPVQRDDMLHLIRRVGTEFGIDIILSSHLLEEVERLCDGAVILAGGRVVAAGAIAELTGADRGLLVEVDGRVDVLTALLEQRGLAVTVDASRLIITRPPSIHPAELHQLVRDALVLTGVGLRRLTTRTVSLEDVFLEVDT